MGDDPLPAAVIPAITQEVTSGPGGSSASGGNSWTIHQGLSKDSQTLVVILSSFALATSICVLVVYLVSRAQTAEHTRDQISASEKRAMDAIAASEKRAMDAVYVAQQTGALAREDVRVWTEELHKRGIAISTSH